MANRPSYREIADTVYNYVRDHYKHFGAYPMDCEYVDDDDVSHIYTWDEIMHSILSEMDKIVIEAAR